MPPKAPTTKAALAQERRTNRRQRAVIDDLREEIETIREQMEGLSKFATANVARFAQMQAEIDRLKAEVARLVR